MTDSPESEPEATVSDPRVVTLQPQPAIAVHLLRPMAELDIGALFGEHLGRVFERIGASGLQVAGPPYARYFMFGPDVCDMEIGVPVVSVVSVSVAAEGSEEVAATHLPAGEVAVTEHRGPYPTLGMAYARLEAWFSENGRASATGPWESYLNSPAEVADHSELRTDVYWPIG
jgi:effector-binding domain-containing protein